MADLVIERVANHLGALSLTLSDWFLEAVEQELGIGGVAPAVLSLLHGEGDLGIERLARVLRVSQPGVSRVVQQLVEAGLVAKRSGKDRRFVRLSLTRRGRTRLARIYKKRGDILLSAVDRLPSRQLQLFGETLQLVLETLPQRQDEHYRMCRLCDQDNCGEAEEDCPVSRGWHARSDQSDYSDAKQGRQR